MMSETIPDHENSKNSFDCQLPIDVENVVFVHVSWYLKNLFVFELIVQYPIIIDARSRSPLFK